MRMLLVLFFLLLGGCSWSDFSRPTVADPIVVDREVLKQCTPIPQYDAKTDELGVRYIELVSQYGICSNKQDASIKVIKILTNTKD